MTHRVLVSSGEGGDHSPAPPVSGDLAGLPAAEDLGHVGDGPAALGQPQHQVVLPVPPSTGRIPPTATTGSRRMATGRPV